MNNNTANVGKAQKGVWTAEEELAYVVRLLLHYKPAPHANDVALPPGRTLYACQHELRRLKERYGEKKDKNKRSAKATVAAAAAAAAASTAGVGPVPTKGKSGKGVKMEEADEDMGDGFVV